MIETVPTILPPEEIAQQSDLEDEFNIFEDEHFTQIVYYINFCTHYLEDRSPGTYSRQGNVTIFYDTPTEVTTTILEENLLTNDSAQSFEKPYIEEIRAYFNRVSEEGINVFSYASDSVKECDAIVFTLGGVWLRYMKADRFFTLDDINDLIEDYRQANPNLTGLQYKERFYSEIEPIPPYFTAPESN